MTITITIPDEIVATLKALVPAGKTIQEVAQANIVAGIQYRIRQAMTIPTQVPSDVSVQSLTSQVGVSIT